MSRPIDALVTGFTKNAVLCEKSLAPLRALRQEGVIRAIHCVTWDSPAIDEFLAPLGAMDDVRLHRVLQPQIAGGASQSSVQRQSANLKAALPLVPEEDALVVKSRPDFVFSPDFLRAKLANFDTLCAPPPRASLPGMELPRGPFSKKIWIPWADANQPFFYEDGAFIGLKRDLALLVTGNIETHYAPLTEPDKCGSFGHVIRFAPAFLPRFPIFRRYLREYSVFVNDQDYRRALVAMMIEDGFFWHLAVAHAWILHTGFHIDCGEPGELALYPNTSNSAAQWSSLESLRMGNPYDDIVAWRRCTRGGLDMLSAVNRTYGRLLDDSWPRAMFTTALPDFPLAMLQQIARGITAYSSGVLNELEGNFYARLRQARENLVQSNRDFTSSPMLANARQAQSVK